MMEIPTALNGLVVMVAAQADARNPIIQSASLRAQILGASRI